MNNAAVTEARSPNVYECDVLGVSPLSVDTFQVEIQAPADTTLNYIAGQYLQLDLDFNGDDNPQSLFYSIANACDPERPRRLQLFIQSMGGLSDKVLQHLRELSDSRSRVKVILPLGKAYLQTDLDSVHLLVAAGSGISQIKAIAEAIVRQQPNAVVHIYWSNKKSEDFYLLDEFRSWSEQYENLRFTAILESPDAAWAGRAGYLYQILGEDFEKLDGVKAYLCGSPNMVYGTIDQLELKGLKEADCYSDVFEYAPREGK